MTDRNLYAPPSAQVGDVPTASASPGAGHFNPDGRSLPAGAGWHWYGAAWRLFKRKPFAWWVVMLIVFGLFGLASVVPLLNLLTSVLMPVLVAGVGACAYSQLHNGGFEIGQVFAGFGARRNALLQAGGLYLLVTVVSMGGMVLLSGGSVTSVYGGSMAERQAAMAHGFAGGGVGFWFYLIVLSLSMCAILFAPYLLLEQQVSVKQALAMSFKACFKNIPATLVWILGYIVWAVVATIPVGLGWLVLIPVLFLTPYMAYRDIFYD